MRRIDGVPRLLRCLFIYLMRNYVNQSHPLKFNKGHDCGMPVRRLKSCVHCRRAKARCSLATPCLRCATRHLDCHYTSTQPRPTNHYRAEGFRPIRPAAEHSAKNAPFETEAAGSASLAPSQGPSLAPEAVSTTDFTGLVTTGTDSPEYDLEACTNSSLDWFGQSNTYNLLLEDESESHGWQPTSDTDTLACFSFEDLLASPYNSTLEFPTVSSRDTNFFSAHDEMTYTSPDSRGQAPATKSPGPQLVQRTRSLIQGSLTAKMLFSRLCDYTRMMADAKTLPPFIYPPCYLGPNDECTPETSHQCLPEALAVCANLSRMFYSRTRESPNFIWQRICTHLRQMKKEVSTEKKISWM
ncbi:hypothetical protein N7450_004465 [Penicillium hetheringtonii]|uniref:Zn(2)-C6 fungal-type domain-containing protein n=1 Tax=Penicillium hetheringtonii TaxID=911720 RepID=A0AAD6DQ24_9EURO|nr:hypothetical protein N7450_004465 [Penicillium hetheringtonii]